MIMLRTAHHELYPDDSLLHVVGENVLDSTSALALAPTSKCCSRHPDFVNNHAITARVLTQALAYPAMQPAVAQLFHQTEGSPQIKLLMAGVDLIPLGPASFAQVANAVA